MVRRNLATKTKKATGAMAILYDGKRDKYYLIEDNGKRRHLPVRRFTGHFDRNSNFVVDEVLEVY